MLLLAVVAIVLRHREVPRATTEMVEEPAAASTTTTTTATATATTSVKQVAAPPDAGRELPIWERPPLRTSQPFPEEARINEERKTPIVLQPWMIPHDGGGSGGD